MFEAPAIFFTLVLMACLAGYAPAQRLAPGLPAGERLALTPLLGAALIVLTVLWVHAFKPLEGGLVLVGLAPVLFGAATVLKDLVRGHRPAPRFSILVWSGLLLAGSAVALAPFFVLGSATSFGLANNDAFWYTQADWRVLKFSYFSTFDQIDSTLARYPSLIQRYGLNYLSVLVQTVAGLRSWQVVHLTGAFGVLLVVLSTALLARRVRLWWPLAMLAGLAAAGNHFTYRLYMDAFMAFSFGLALLLAIIWFLVSPAVTGSSNRHLLLLGILFAALIVFYLDIAVVAAAVATATAVFGRKPDFKRLGMLSFSVLTAILLSAPMALVVPLHFRTVAAATAPGTFFAFPNLMADFCYLSGTMNWYSMLRGAHPRVLSVAGGMAVLVLLAHGLWSLRRAPKAFCTVFWYAAPLGALFIYLLFVKRNEYSAHRVYAMMATIAGVVALKGLERKWMTALSWRPILAGALLVFAVIAAAFPGVELLSEATRTKIRVTGFEKELGDVWIPSLPANSRILIDAGDDTDIFYPHYMYWEALYGAGFDERRVLFPSHRYAYITPAKRLEELDLASCTHILRRRDVHRVEGDLRPLRSNARYELMSADVIYYHSDGFYGAETDGGRQSRWMRQDGKIVIVSAESRNAEFRAALYRNPALPRPRIAFQLNGRRLGEEMDADGAHIALPLSLSAGYNTLLIHSSNEPVPPNALDARPMTIRFVDSQIARAPRPARR